MKLEWDFKEVFDFADRLGNLERFDAFMEEAVREIGDALRKLLKANTPVVTGKLQHGWDNDATAFSVEKAKNGFIVTLTNDVEYAYYVNYGHYSYNQFNKGGEPYVVKNRVKVPVPHSLQITTSEKFVYGHFFVEDTMIKFENSAELNRLILEHLDKWFGWCVNG